MQAEILTVPKKKSLPRRLGRMIVLIGSPFAVLLGGLYIYIFDPNKQSILYVPCAFYESTGYYCPGCGNTRALHALVHLRLLEMIDHNLLFPFLFFSVAWLLLGEYLNLLLGHRVLWLPKKIPIWLGVLALILVGLFVLLRNLPFFPFGWLAPGLS
jgi:hypothetical protein